MAFLITSRPPFTSDLAVVCSSRSRTSLLIASSSPLAFPFTRLLDKSRSPISDTPLHSTVTPYDHHSSTPPERGQFPPSTHHWSFSGKPPFPRARRLLGTQSGVSVSSPGSSKAAFLSLSAFWSFFLGPNGTPSSTRSSSESSSSAAMSICSRTNVGMNSEMPADVRNRCTAEVSGSGSSASSSAGRGREHRVTAGGDRREHRLTAGGGRRPGSGAQSHSRR